MKPEPLKSKKVLRTEAEDIGIVNPDRPFFLDNSPAPLILFKKEDVYSAVEWLKHKIHTHIFSSGYDRQLVLEFLNEAFEDVVKK